MLRCSNRQCAEFVPAESYVKIYNKGAIWIYCCWTCARDCNDE